MQIDFFPREWVAEQLHVGVRTLERYERAGLVQSTMLNRTRGYRAADVMRLRTALTLERDLGINLAGVEVVLQMRERMEGMMKQMRELIEWAEHVRRAGMRPISRNRSKRE